MMFVTFGKQSMKRHVWRWDGIEGRLRGIYGEEKRGENNSI